MTCTPIVEPAALEPNQPGRSGITGWRVRCGCGFSSSSYRKRAAAQRAAVSHAVGHVPHGRDSNAAYFVDAITRATADAERMAAEALFAHRFTDWRAALAYLERRNPERWGNRSKVEHSGTVRTGEPELVAPEDEQRQRVTAILAEAGALTAAAAELDEAA